MVSFAASAESDCCYQATQGFFSGRQMPGAGVVDAGLMRASALQAAGGRLQSVSLGVISIKGIFSFAYPLNHYFSFPVSIAA
jgi:hypothetical protein